MVDVETKVEESDQRKISVSEIYILIGCFKGRNKRHEYSLRWILYMTTESLNFTR